MIDRATKERLSSALEECLRILAETPTEVASVVQAPKAVPEPANDDASFAFADYGRFYDTLRKGRVLGPSISTPEFKGCDAILKACAAANWPISFAAYALATAYWETKHTMQPIDEDGGTAYFTRMYDIRGNRPAKARELGNLSPGDGARFHGRGYVQLTGKRNYAFASEKLGVDLVANPELAKRPDIAAAVMVIGMEHGWFTTRKLRDDLPAKGQATVRQFKDSRDIINGHDKEDEIAQIAVTFQAALANGGYKIAA